MRVVKTMDELKIPAKHSKFIVEFLKQAQQIKTFNMIDMIILFGSCARGNATLTSDVDIMAVGDGIGDETLFCLYDCAWYPGIEQGDNLVNNDVFVNDRLYFDQRSTIPGTLQWRVAKDGVILNELL